MALPKRHYISTGDLSALGMVLLLVQGARRRSRSNCDGKKSQADPALAQVLSELFGVCFFGPNGRSSGTGDVDHEFSIMSVSKPFRSALTCETIGPGEARVKLGANAIGLPSFSHAKLPPAEIQAQVDLGDITRVSKDQLRSGTQKATATPRQVLGALRVNTEARLQVCGASGNRSIQTSDSAFMIG